MTDVRSDDASEVPTAPERGRARPREHLDTLDHPPPGWSIGLDDPGDVAASDGLESQVLLARARQKLLGWDDMPVTVGRYRVLERIGQGGMGVVYSAHDDELDRDVAIKILRSELAPGTAGRQRLVREAQATAKLSHPNVVHVYEVAQQGEQVFMAMELVRGRTLRAWLESKRRTWQEVVAMFVQAGEGLVAAHAHGIVHRDFKPDNVLIGVGSADRERPRVVDFGLARASSDVVSTGEHPVFRDLDITRTGTVIGTPAYMAPEQLSRGEPDARSDQFSFCVALFEALYRHRPFAGSTYTELADSLTAGVPIAIDDRGEVPSALHAIVMRGLSRNPFDRHPSMRALLDELVAVTRARPRRRGWLAAAAIAACAGIVGLAVLLRPRAEHAEPTAALPPPEQARWADVVAASELPPELASPLAGDPAQMQVARLDNGLTIYVAHRPLEPMVAVGLAIRASDHDHAEYSPVIAGVVISSIIAGSAKVGTTAYEAEAPQLAYQHALIERLPEIREPAARELLLRTIAASESASDSLAAPGELFTGSDALGGRNTMIVHHHGTMFAVKQPAHRVGPWLQLAAELVRRPVFRGFLGITADRLAFAGGFGADRPSAAAQYAALAPATGIVRDRELAVAKLLEVPLAEAREFHATYYRPNNTALVFVGDITLAQARALAERSFGDWEPAQLPARTTVDAELIAPRTLIEATAPGAPMVTLTWPMPPIASPEYAELDTLMKALNGHRGLLAATLHDDAHGWGAQIGDARDLHIMAVPGTGESPEATERALLEALGDIAEDRLSDDDWAAALGEAELDRLDWARGPGELLLAAGDSFFARQPWSTTAEALAAAPTRPQLVAVARRLLARNHVVTYERSGKITQPVPPTLPRPAATAPTWARSRFVDELVRSPAPQVEPRFLVEGSHFDRSTHGAGQIITTNAEGPLFWLTWVVPVGAAEDPWACDAMRARMETLAVTGVHVTVACTTADTRVRVVGPTARFDELIGPLVAWLEGTDYTNVHLQRYAEQVVENRRSERAQPFLLTMWTDFAALLGTHAVDPHVPSDEELLAGATKAIPAARAAMAAFDPDVLYVGPHADRLRAALPPPRGRTSGPPLRREYREAAAHEVFGMHDPDHDRVSVHASIPWLAETPVEQLAALIHEEVVAEQEHTGRFEADYDHLGYQLTWSPGPPLAIGLGYRVGPDQVDAALAAAKDALRHRPSRDGFAHAHQLLETGFRAQRWAPRHVPELVYSWGPDGSDPRVAQWLALPSLRYEDLLRYYDRVDATAPALVVVGDLDAAKTEAELVRLTPQDTLREASLVAFGRELGAIMDD